MFELLTQKADNINNNCFRCCYCRRRFHTIFSLFLPFIGEQRAMLEYFASSSKHRRQFIGRCAKQLTENVLYAIIVDS